MANLIGKNVLIVDEVDDTRTTLEYAVRELEKDVETAVKKLGREGEKTNFSIFVLHNKDKPKKGMLPQEILKGRYAAARTVGDVWINYPWEATYVLLGLDEAVSETNEWIGTLMSMIAFRGSRSQSNKRLDYL
jgi:hypoxanthine phosphoribosyltransferase